MFHKQYLDKILLNNLSKKQQNIVCSSLFECINNIERGSLLNFDVIESCFKQKENTSFLRAYIHSDKYNNEYINNIKDKYNINKNKGLFNGIPFAIKDNFCTTYPSVPKDDITTAGSKILENFISPYNATIVDRITKQHGFIIGKTNLDEFAMGSTTSHSSLYDYTINPWSLTLDNGLDKDNVLSAGGSSGGSAVAVASYSAFVGIGSDTGGSVRQPAAWNGIIGLKPSYGTLSRFGLIAYGSSLDCPGIFTRDILDCSIVLDSLSGPDVNDNCTMGSNKTDTYNTIKDIKLLKKDRFIKQSGDKIRIGIPKEYWVNELSSDTVHYWEYISSIMEKAGAEVVECSLPHTKYSLPVYLIIANAEASSNLARYDGVRYGYRSSKSDNITHLVNNSRKEAIGNEVQRRIIMGTFALSRESYDSFFKRAQLVRRLIKEDFDNCFENNNIDVLLTPTVPSPVKRLKDALSLDDPVEEYLNDLMTIPANLAGIPAISIPVGIQNNLPIGMQLMSNKGNEKILLETSAILETILTNK